MKHLIILLFSTIFLYSCDPDVPGEGITLPHMEFGFKVNPDTDFIKIGDTIKITTAISNILRDGTIIKDGIATISASIGYSDEIPLKKTGMLPAKNGLEIDVIEFFGTTTFNKSGSIGDLIAYLNEDSITLKIGIIPKKKGTYCIQLSSKFFEGTQGKTRTQPYFDMEDCHWDLYQVAEYPGPNPGEEGYNKSYWFAVYE